MNHKEGLLEVSLKDWVLSGRGQLSNVWCLLNLDVNKKKKKKKADGWLRIQCQVIVVSFSCASPSRFRRNVSQPAFHPAKLSVHRLEAPFIFPAVKLPAASWTFEFHKTEVIFFNTRLVSSTYSSSNKSTLINAALSVSIFQQPSSSSPSAWGRCLFKRR